MKVVPAAHREHGDPDDRGPGQRRPDAGSPVDPQDEERRPRDDDEEALLPREQEEPEHHAEREEVPAPRTIGPDHAERQVRAEHREEGEKRLGAQEREAPVVDGQHPQEAERKNLEPGVPRSEAVTEPEQAVGEPERRGDVLELGRLDRRPERHAERVDERGDEIRERRVEVLVSVGHRGQPELREREDVPDVGAGIVRDPRVVEHGVEEDEPVHHRVEADERHVDAARPEERTRDAVVGEHRASP